MTGANYESRRGAWTFLHDSYRGGFHYAVPTRTSLSDVTVQWSAITEDGVKVNERRFQSYLVPFPGESDVSFEYRRQLATYVNPVQLIVDAYAQSCTSDVQRSLGEIEQYMDDVDLRGSTWGEFVEDGAIWNAVYGITATIVEAPRQNTARNRAEEYESGTRPYCVRVHPPSWAWIDVDEFGRVTEFAYVDQPYQSNVVASTAQQKVRVRIYRAGNAQAPAGTWEIREGVISTVLGKTLSEQRDAFGEVVDSGALPTVLGGQIPVVFGGYKRDTTSRYPMGDSLVEDAAMLARSIYNKRSCELQIAREAGFPTLAVPMASTGGQMDAGTKRAIGPSKAIGYDSSSGAPSWIQPSSEWAKDLRESCMQDFQLALRSAGMELAAEAGASSSGEALRIRSRDFEARAKKYARSLQREEMAILHLYALLAGESPDEIKITYAKRFTLPDLSADLDRALKLLRESPIEIGPTAKIAAGMQMINAAVTLSDEDQTKVRDEIERVLLEDVEDIKATREIQKVARARQMKQLDGEEAEPESQDEQEAEQPEQAA